MAVLAALGCSDPAELPDASPAPDAAPDAAPVTCAEPAGWSFVALADPRSDGRTFRTALGEARWPSVNPAPCHGPAELLVVVGDSDPNPARYADFQGAFAGDPDMRGYYPVMGNHDYEDAVDRAALQDTILSAQPLVTRRSATEASYVVDHRNLRLIAVDGYAELGNGGCLNADGRAWVEAAIAATSADHVVVTFHEPAFPRARHVGDSFDACPDERDAFWNMLLAHRDKVRLVLVGHTHAYSRMRVLDPQGAVADPETFPDEPGGLHQIDCGAAGNGSRSTLVRVEVQADRLWVRTLQAADGEGQPFAVADELEIPRP